MEVTDISGCINEDPGVQIQGSVTPIKASQKVPVMIVNKTNRVYKLKRGNVVGQAKAPQTRDVSSATSSRQEE